MPNPGLSSELSLIWCSAQPGESRSQNRTGKSFPHQLGPTLERSSGPHPDNRPTRQLCPP
jgi:hypothetical protein